MRVRLGWSGEIEPNVWSKADVELDESDLDRLLNEAEVPEEVEFSTRVVFQLLQNEAEMLLLSKLVGQGYPEEKARARTKALEYLNEHILTTLKQKAAPDPESFQA